MKRSGLNNFIFIFSLLILTSCGNSVQEDKRNDVNPAGINQPVNEILFSQEQIEMANIQTGSLTMKNMSESVICNGQIEAPPHQKASVSVPMQGYVKQILVHSGEYVSKGKPLVQLQHPNYIDIQKNYLQTVSREKYLSKEYERQQILYEENVNTAKKYQEIESQYNSVKAEKTSLYQKIKLLGIQPETITEGSISSTITVKAPISGSVNDIFISIGQFIEPKDVMIQLIDRNRFHLGLQVFEKDINKMRKGQNIQFTVADTGDDIYHASVKYIGQSVSPETRTFEIIGQPEKFYQSLRPGMFVTAKILIGDEEVPALPQEAVIRDGQEYFIFVETSPGTYKKQQITTGNTADGFIEMKTRLSDTMINKIVLEGANYIFAEMGDE